MLYLPGIDGIGMAAYRSFPDLARAFDFKALMVPPTSRQPFEDLVEIVKVGYGRVTLRGAARPLFRWRWSGHVAEGRGLGVESR